MSSLGGEALQDRALEPGSITIGLRALRNLPDTRDGRAPGCRAFDPDSRGTSPRAAWAGGATETRVVYRGCSTASIWDDEHHEPLLPSARDPGTVPGRGRRALNLVQDGQRAKVLEGQHRVPESSPVRGILEVEVCYRTLAFPLYRPRARRLPDLPRGDDCHNRKMSYLEKSAVATEVSQCEVEGRAQGRSVMSRRLGGSPP